MVKKLNDLIGLYQVYFFDFDGVIINSDRIRVEAFEYALKNFNDKLISDFLNYHKENGGLSRYNKFDRFRNLTGSSDEDVINWLKLYNDYCKEKLIESSLLIKETLSMIKNLNKHNYKLYIVSASDQEELRFIVKSQNIDKYFNGILGSPTTKKENVSNLILHENKFGFSKKDYILIGDSINDFHAAQENFIDFFGFGNEKIKNKTNLINGIS